MKPRNITSQFAVITGMTLLVLLVLVVTYIARPYFGNMDDGLLLEQAATKSPFSFAHDYGWRPGAGFLNDFSMLIVWPTYWIGSLAGPSWFFLVNSLLVFVCILAFGLALGKIMGWEGSCHNLVFLAGTLLWPYTADLFFFPSLQEKGIILGVAILLWWIYRAPTFNSVIFFWLSLTIACAAAFTSKTHILLFIPALLFALWTLPEIRTQRFARRAVGATVVILALAALLAFLAVGGTYSQSTRGTVGISFLKDPRFLMIAALTCVYVTALIIRGFLHKSNAADWIPAMMLLTMCGAFAVWEIRNYFLSIAGVMVGAALATAIGWMSPSWRRTGVTTALVVAACFWLLLRLPTIYGSLASIGDFLTSPVVRKLNAEQADIYVSCLEAPNHYNTYAGKLGLTGLTFAFLEKESLNVIPSMVDKYTYVLADDRLCAWSPNSVGWELVWTTGDAGSFQLFRHSSQEFTSTSMK